MQIMILRRSVGPDPYCITRAAAKVADGENVIFKILRNGEVMDLELHQ